ncbi:MAG: peptidase inhibitor family I36 protein [Streptomycetaceae bacterium]|nr:peptidase inhibitor family I36 protein [Streptomycetaceae bacterium]
MTVRKVTKAALGASAAALSLVLGFSGTAFAGDNSSATVEGVTGFPAGSEQCDNGYFCLFTGPGATGTVFRLYQCKEYNLYNWNGIGSWENWNNGGAHALIQDKNYNTLIDSDPGNNVNDESYDFTPVWHVKAC